MSPETPGYNPDFLKEKYSLHNAEEVDAAAERTEARTGNEVPQDPASRIQNYLERFTGILEREDPKHRERGVEAVKKVLLDKFATQPKDIPESYWKSQESILRDRGQQADYDQFSDEQKDNWKQEIAEGLLSDQRDSLEQWIDYLSSPDSVYMPPEIKYWAFRSVTGMAEYDKDKSEFPKRSKGTVKQFPDINHEALSYVIDAMMKKFRGETMEFEYDIQPDERIAFQRALAGENFSKLYGWAHELMNPIPEHLLPVTEGEWVTFPQGSDHHKLVQAIRGKGTGWCTAGETTAKKQLEGGAFELFCTKDDDDNYTIPRIAIRKEGDKIVEIRGVAQKQNLDPYMGDILEAKLQEFPDKDEYLKKDHDTKALTAIEQATKANQPLNAKQLRFLYEIDSRIEGFGYQRDPRIAELRSTRNPQEDMPTVFECSPAEIAHSATEITADTKAYVGPLVPGIFQMLPEGIEHMYTSFPENPIHQDTVEIGGTTKENLIRQLKDKNINISDYVKDMLNSRDFTTSKESEAANLVRLTVESLGFPRGATTDEIYRKAEELGLELCPAEVGPQYRLKYGDQPMNDYFFIGMKQITDRNGFPLVFYLDRHPDGSWLDNDIATPGGRWNPDNQFAFRLRKLKT